MLDLLPVQEMVTLCRGAPDTEDGWVSTDWAQEPGRGRDTEMVMLGLGTRGGIEVPCGLPGSPLLSPHPGTCAVSEEGEEERGPGHGGDDHRVLSSVSPQLKQNFPQVSPSPLQALTEGGATHANETPAF